MSLAYCIFLINQYKTRYDHQSSKLIQTYLNKEFVTRVLNIMVSSTESRKDKIIMLISKIKDYFDLDEIVFYNTEDYINDIHHGTFYRNIIRQYIDENICSISEALSTNSIDIRKMKYDKIHFMLYIIPIENNSKMKCIVFVQNNQDSILNSRDIDTLSKPIRIILSAIFAKKIFY